MGLQETPKQPQAARLQDWYPYYAGYSMRFVDHTFDNCMPDANSVLDPWNGSGTTTTVAATRGLAYSGLDINPAVTVIARARLTPASIVDSVSPLADEILHAARRLKAAPFDNDPLIRWFQKPAVDAIRSLHHAIGVVLAGRPSLPYDLRNDPGPTTSQLPVLAAFFYAALFASVRDLLQPFRATNPTWLRFPQTSRHRVSPTPQHLAETFTVRVSFLASRLSLPDNLPNVGQNIRTASVLDLESTPRYDACLTSPPYATRVDYVRSTLAELSVLGLSDAQIDHLRSATLGTPKVRGKKRAIEDLRSETARKVVALVKDHPSHGSSGYYAPWICNYLTTLEESLARIDAAVVAGGTIALVAQDSYYKAIKIDLQCIIEEMMQGLGREIRMRSDHDARHLFTRINPAAKKYLGSRTNTESLLVFT